MRGARLLQASRMRRVRRASPPDARFPGDHTGGATPVPIPNTAVKPAGPMIVPQARKSVIAGVQSPGRPRLPRAPGGFFCARPLFRTRNDPLARQDLIGEGSEILLIG